MNPPRTLADIIEECLDRVLEGGESIDACLAEYPGHTEELREALEPALAVQSAFAYQPNVDRKRQNRLRMLATLEHRPRRFSWLRLPIPRGLLRSGPRVAALALAAVLALVGSGTGTALASQGSSPGDILYQVKRSAERVQLAFTFTDVRESKLRTELLDRRVDELLTVTEAGHEQFVPELVNQIERHSDRVRRIAMGPVSDAVARLPVLDGVRIGATPSADTRGPDEGVSVRFVLSFDRQLSDMESRIGEAQRLVRADAHRKDLKRLWTGMAGARQQLESLLKRADQIHLYVDEIIERDRLDAEYSRERPDGEAAPATPTPLPNTTIRPDASIKAEVIDVVLHLNFRSEGLKLARVDLQVLMPDGTERQVKIERGKTRLIREGRAAGVRDITVGGTVTLVVERSTDNVISVIVSPRMRRQSDTGKPRGAR
jgi:hypothetical protein